MPVAPAFVDAERATRDWVNSLTADLVGAGHPLELGAHLKRLRSPAGGSYVLLTNVTSGDGWLAEGGSMAHISGAVYGATKEGAARAAVDYANALRRLQVGNTTVGEAPNQVVILTSDNITGPFYVPDGDEERYFVDADLYFTPAP